MGLIEFSAEVFSMKIISMCICSTVVRSAERLSPYIRAPGKNCKIDDKFLFVLHPTMAVNEYAS